MANFDSIMECKALWLGDLLPAKTMSEIEQLCANENLEKLLHKRFILPHSLVGERGFTSPRDAEEQAYLQVLAHVGCIPSCLLFGLSLSGQQPRTQRVLSELHAYGYMYLGIESILQNHTDSTFLDEADYMFASSTMIDIFSFVAEKGPSLGFHLQDSPVVQFATLGLKGMTSSLNLN